MRLSDGAWWLLPGTLNAPWQWEIPVALTCSELFAKVWFQSQSDAGFTGFGYARVRLDSLGPGSPPQ